MEVGYAQGASIALSYSDPVWDDHCIGQNDYFHAIWTHEPHKDSPWRKPLEMCNTTVTKFTCVDKDGEALKEFPFYEKHLSNPSWMEHFGRFDYLFGRLNNRTLQLRTDEDIKADDAQTPGAAKDVNTANSSLFNSFTSDMARICNVNSARNSATWFRNVEGADYWDKQYEVDTCTSAAGNLGQKYNNRDVRQMYMENNNMRPLLFTLAREMNSENIQPMYVSTTIAAVHTFLMRIHHMNGWPIQRKTLMANALKVFNTANWVRYPMGQYITNQRLHGLFIRSNQLLKDGAQKSISFHYEPSWFEPYTYPLFTSQATETIGKSAVNKRTYEDLHEEQMPNYCKKICI